MREYAVSFQKDYKIELQILILLINLLSLCFGYLLAFATQAGRFTFKATHELIKLEEHVQVII